MSFLITLTKICLIMVSVLLMAAPFALEYITFGNDREGKITYKRFKTVIFTFVYLILVTIVLYLFKELGLWIGSWRFIQWISSRFATTGRVAYLIKLFATVFINFGIGALYIFLSKFFRIGMKKKDFVNPKKKNGKFSLGQRINRAVIKFFHTETWFFVAKVLFALAILLSIAYAIVFTLYLIPAFFGASWLPYKFISMLFSAGYIYPSITLMAIWQSYFFLEGIRRAVDECPDILKAVNLEITPLRVDVEAIDKEVKKHFGGHYACDVKLSETLQEKLSANEHSEITKYVGMAVENDRRNPQLQKEVYLECLDRIVEATEKEKSVLISGNFFSEFAMYFLRYLSIVSVRGDNMIFVCNDEAQIDSVYNYLNEALSELSSLYCKNFSKDAVDFDDPIWRIVKISGEHDVIEEAVVDDNCILVTTLGYICSTHFEREHSKFINLLDTVVFVDTLGTVNNYSRQMSLLNTRLKHITKTNATLAKNSKDGKYRIRYMAHPIRYMCFDDTRTPGLDRVLTNMLSVDFISADAMHYSAKTLVRCYNYESRADEKGKRVATQFVNTEEEIGAVINMALLCLEKGASNVTVFAEGSIPYANIAESLNANSGQMLVSADADKLRLNKRFYNPDEYSVIIAIDSGDNLPAAIRRYASMVSDKPALVIVFSRQYMMRDYYVDNIDKLWLNDRTVRIPVSQTGKKEVAQKILVKANSGGISEEEILYLAGGVASFKEYVDKKDINGILRAILEIYGVDRADSLEVYNYFEYSSSLDFDESGVYDPKDKVFLRRQGQLFDMINCRDNIILVRPDDEVTLPLPKSRLTQNFIAMQNFLYGGAVYVIRKLDTEEGKIFASLAVSGSNRDVYNYIQAREYIVGASPDKIEKVLPTAHTVVGRSVDDIGVNDIYISVFKAPVEVHTNGYYEVDPYTHTVKKDSYHSINDKDNDFFAKQSFRRYGKVRDNDGSEDIMKSSGLAVSGTGALMMSIRLTGNFGADINRTMLLAAAMLNEQIHAMFPSVADSVVVCPVLHGEISFDNGIPAIIPKMTVEAEESIFSENDFELVIIEDSSVELGVVSMLATSGENILATLFEPVYEYLTWYMNANDKSRFLYYTLDREPDCFDFTSLHKLSTLLGYGNRDVKFESVDDYVEYVTCDFCGKRVANGEGITTLDDGRKMCKECAAQLVGKDQKTLKEHLASAKLYLESTYSITIGDDYDVCFESTTKIVNTLKQNKDLMRRGTDVPFKSYVENGITAHAEYGIPSVSLSEMLVRELTHLWQRKNLPDLTEELAEGHIALVSVQYLRFIRNSSLVTIRTNYYESNANLSGKGYRKLASELLSKPQYSNNPFLYLLEFSGIDAATKIIPRKTPTSETGKYGDVYTPEAPDRETDVKYFYYSYATESEKKAYDIMLEAIKTHAESVDVAGFTFEEKCRIVKMIAYDHPEIFWYNNISGLGDKVIFHYGATAEECAALQVRIDEAAAKYLEGIDDSMTAYDVALNLQIKMINSVDYDTVQLNIEAAEGGTPEDKIDYIRTICGVFIDHEAVCAGYARAMQYLLQKCGIESAYAAGIAHCSDGTSGPHAWNIVKMDGDYYYIDTTWDDSSNTIQSVKNYDLGFSYFGLTTEEMQRSRDFSRCPIQMPVLTATRANYYTHNNLVLTSFDVNRIKEIAVNAATAKQDFFTFKCASAAVYDAAFSWIASSSSDVFAVIRAAAKVDKRIDTNRINWAQNERIRTITIKFLHK